MSVFPVIFFDGEREINIGNIRIQPTLVFKPFQLILSEKIGISPNQISIYLCDRNRKIPVTSKANFALISREKNCFFLVILKRSRKARNRKVKENVLFPHEFHRIMHKELVSMNERVQNLQIQRENFDLLMKKSGPDPGQDPGQVYLDSPNSFPRIEDTFPKKKGVCYECENTTAFHHCKNDAVIVGLFRSRSGPVTRPAK